MHCAGNAKYREVLIGELRRRAATRLLLSVAHDTGDTTSMVGVGSSSSISSTEHIHDITVEGVVVA